MKLMTLQNNLVIRKFLKRDLYVSNDLYVPLDKSFFNTKSLDCYIELANYLGYDSRPIFSLNEGSMGSARGTANNSVNFNSLNKFTLLQLNVPSEFCIIQNFDYWELYMEGKCSIDDTFKYITPFSNIQVILPCIKDDWLIAYSAHPYVVEAFAKYHIFNESSNITRNYDFYINKANKWKREDLHKYSREYEMWISRTDLGLHKTDKFFDWDYLNFDRIIRM